MNNSHTPGASAPTTTPDLSTNTDTQIKTPPHPFVRNDPGFTLDEVGEVLAFLELAMEAIAYGISGGIPVKEQNLTGVQAILKGTVSAVRYAREEMDRNTNQVKPNHSHGGEGQS